MRCLSSASRLLKGTLHCVRPALVQPPSPSPASPPSGERGWGNLTTKVLAARARLARHRCCQAVRLLPAMYPLGPFPHTFLAPGLLGAPTSPTPLPHLPRPSPILPAPGPIKHPLPTFPAPFSGEAAFHRITHLTVNGDPWSTSYDSYPAAPGGPHFTFKITRLASVLQHGGSTTISFSLPPGMASLDDFLLSPYFSAFSADLKHCPVTAIDLLPASP